MRVAHPDHLPFGHSDPLKDVHVTQAGPGKVISGNFTGTTKKGNIFSSTNHGCGTTSLQLQGASFDITRAKSA